jgi:hypothetical protein
VRQLPTSVMVKFFGIIVAYILKFVFQKTAPSPTEVLLLDYLHPSVTAFSQNDFWLNNFNRYSIKIIKKTSQ